MSLECTRLLSILSYPNCCFKAEVSSAVLNADKLINVIFLSLSLYLSLSISEQLDTEDAHILSMHILLINFLGL